MDGIVIVTGGFGALGRAVVKRLAHAGAKVVAVDIAEERVVEGASLAIGGIDGAEPETAARAIALVSSRFGRLDGLVNIAGGFRWEEVREGSLETWDAQYRVNLRSCVAMSQAAAPLLAAAGGAIVNVGAAATLKAGAGMGAYTASKSGVARFTEALAEELKDRMVRVNAVLPSIIDTPANRADLPDADFTRWVRPESLAEVVAFLLSEQASAVTGALIPVTGRM